MTIADRRRPFDQHAETSSPQPGDAFSTTAARTEGPPRRCAGTGTVTAVIPLADAVLLDDRACPGCDDCAAEQQLAEAVARARMALAEYDRPEGVEP